MYRYKELYHPLRYCTLVVVLLLEFKVDGFNMTKLMINGHIYAKTFVSLQKKIALILALIRPNFLDDLVLISDVSTN